MDDENLGAFAERAIFVESLWWFLHRSTGFAVCATAEELAASRRAAFLDGLRRRHAIDASSCSENMVSCTCFLFSGDDYSISVRI